MSTKAPNLRHIVLARLRQLGLTEYWLSRHPDIDCVPETVTRWLRGRNDIGASRVAEILHVLDLDVQPRARRKGRSR